MPNTRRYGDWYSRRALRPTKLGTCPHQARSPAVDAIQRLTGGPRSKTVGIFRVAVCWLRFLWRPSAGHALKDWWSKRQPPLDGAWLFPLWDDEKMTAPLSLGIDIGGTFTDLVVHDPRDGRAVIWKESTTP